MIGIDWGTTSLRAWRLGPDGSVIEARSVPRGIMTVTDRRFEPVLRETAGDWLADGETKTLLCGMIGSRQGWVETPYLRCPAGTEEIAAQLTPVAFEGGSVSIVPGLYTNDSDGVPDIMRGEETQIIGAGADGRVVCLPGTHSKWARIAQGRIERFATYMTGETFAALATHTILARTLRKAPIDQAAFDAGLIRAAQPGGLLHHAFGVRTRVLREGISETAAYGYLSGLVIGHEMNAALADCDGPVTVVGAPSLTSLYVRAIAARGVEAAAVGEVAAAAGLASLGARIGWI